MLPGYFLCKLSSGLKMRIETIGVIGANALGREIALAALLGGYRVVLEDVSSEVLVKGSASIKQSLDERAAHRELSQQERESALARFSTASRVDEVCRVADMLIDTVPDEMEVKLEIFTIFDKFAKPGAILASNTSLSITEIASITFRAEDCIGMRFANRAPKITRVELVRGADTSDATIAACSEAARRMGMEVAIIYESAEPSAAGEVAALRAKGEIE
jgi:3-hydroxybutyryl-CoA dehydrogenase